MFANEGYVYDDLNSLYNQYVNYINTSLNNNGRRDITFEFLMDRLFNVSESNYSRKNNEINLYKQEGYIKNEYQFYRDNLSKIFNNNYGNNIQYTSSTGYNDSSYSLESRNNLGLEYIGSALVNNSNNNSLWSENGSNINIQRGLETSFFKNECIVRLSDLYQNIHSTLIGKITHTSKYTDEYGNVTIDYDLFSDLDNQFTICDIVIGLDSQAIGVIVPYDYKYTELPNLEIKLLGLGAYILHTQSNINNEFYDIFKSIDNTIRNNAFLSKYFIKEYSRWIIEQNKTRYGFYIKLNTIPNITKLSRSVISNLKIYTPEFFKFLDGNDSPLNLFGFVNQYYNNEFNYFKDNYTPYELGLINKSYVLDSTTRNLVLIFEMKEGCNVEVNDTIFCENHEIISTNINSFNDAFYNVELLEPFSKYITKLELIYNSQIQNYNGFSKIVPYKSASYKNNYDYFNDKLYSLDICSNTIGIPFKNKYIAHNFNENQYRASDNYFLYYNRSPNNNNNEIFKIVYSDTQGLFMYFNNDLSNDILNKYRNEKVDYQIKIIPFENIENNIEAQYYYKSYNSTLFIKSPNSNLDLFTINRYYIKIHIYRKPIVFKSRDISSNIITQYDTLGVFERIMTEWMTRMNTIYRADVNKANYFNQKYNPYIFKNRIIKLKVSPIDNKGFSYEPLTSISTSTNGPNRQIKGYSRKLFPYHEYSIYNTYDGFSTGQQIVINGNVYRNYLRPKQNYTNNEVDAKLFLPGMGVYIVNETINNNITGILPATSYDYTNKFVGYVLDTSIDTNNTSYFRNYMLNADTFSNVD
jgi:hypothetical protein